MNIAYLLIGLAVGGVAVGVIMYFINKSKHPFSLQEYNDAQQQLRDMEINLKLAEGRATERTEALAEIQRLLEEARRQAQEYSNVLAARNEELKNLNEKLATQKKDIEDLQVKFRDEFKNLANDILENNTKKFTDQNKTNLFDLLNPLKEKITDFEKKVEQTNKESIERNSSLREQILGLKELNQQMTKDAKNLTRALKGESKTQGNWGEFILESILEKSGLTKGDQYEMQVSMTDAAGKRLQPDVVVHLPEQKNLVIDSKVSLTSYEKYVNAEDEQGQQEAIKNHLLSIRAHIKGLSEKNYQHLYQIGSLDFVLLFMPVEPAFGLAVQHDPGLFNDAYEKNIVIVSPSTLIATLRTIASIWRQENQNRNAMEIARQGGQLYDKFKAFTDDLIKVGDNLKMTKKNYDLAMNKLSEGKDNLIRKTERIRELGAKASKSLDQRLIDRALDE